MDSVEHGRTGMPDLASDPESLAARLRRYRAATGLTQEELAARAGVSVRSLGDVERGAGHHPRKDTVRLLAEALGLSPEERGAFIAAARAAPPPVTGDDASPCTRDHGPLTAVPLAVPEARRRSLWTGAPLTQRRAVGALVVLVALVALGVPTTAAVWVRRPVATPVASATPATTIVGPDRPACCWAKQGAWYADGLHGYPGFAGPTYWTWARGATGAPLAAVRWSFTPPLRGAGDGRRVAVDVWVPDNNADARVAYVITDGRGRPHRRVVDQESPVPGFVHHSPGWVSLGVFDGTRDGRRWGGLMVDLTDRAPTDCAAYHYASRTCTVGAAQARFSSPASGVR